MLTALNYFQTLARCLSGALGGLCLTQRAAGSNPYDNKSQERKIRVIGSSTRWGFFLLFLQEWRECYGNGVKLHVEMIKVMEQERGFVNISNSARDN